MNFDGFIKDQQRRILMAFINTIPPGKATGETAEVYKSLAQVEGHGMIPKIVQVFSLKPAAMKMIPRQISNFRPP